MGVTYASNAKTILHIFKDANLIPEIVSGASELHGAIQKKVKKQATRSKPKPREKPIKTDQMLMNQFPD